MSELFDKFNQLIPLNISIPEIPRSRLLARFNSIKDVFVNLNFSLSSEISKIREALKSSLKLGCFSVFWISKILDFVSAKGNCVSELRL